LNKPASLRIVANDGEPELKMKISTPVFVPVETSAYSGATLLSFLLGAHPEIATIGEMDGLIPTEDPDLYLCSCGQRIKECEFWQAVQRAMQAQGFEFDVAHFDTKFVLGGPRPIQYLRIGSFRNNTLDGLRDMAFYSWPEEKRRLKALVARNEAFIKAVLAVTGKRVFVDTSKDRLRARALRKFSSLDVRAIHLVRDARGVVASRLRREGNIGPAEAARQWVRLHQKFQIALQAWPKGKSVRVRYEDLCREPQTALQQLYHFCGVDPAVNLGDFRAVPHHIVGNPMRLNNITEIKLDERWHSLLTAEQLADINRIAGPLSRQYGYS
jgi:hypothetical protein